MLSLLVTPSNDLRAFNPFLGNTNNKTILLMEPTGITPSLYEKYFDTKVCTKTLEAVLKLCGF